MAVYRHASLALLLVATACVERVPTGNTILVAQDVGSGTWGSVSTGLAHTCALTVSGQAYCWGSNARGQLGVPAVDSTCPPARTPCSLHPVSVATTVRFLSISAGGSHTCGIGADGTAYCWGDNTSGQTGGASSGGPALLTVAGGSRFTRISAGFSHTCAVRTDGVALCWGANDRGQLGTGDTTASPFPRPVSTSFPVEQLSAGQGRTCAITTAGPVLCWGAIWEYSQGGFEYTRSQLLPQYVPQAPALVSVSVGTFTTCGIDATGAGWCWEGNPHGEMGVGGTSGSSVPLPVAGGLRFLAISAGIIQTCGITVSGRGYCWGNDSFGQLGVLPGVLTERCSGQNLVCSTTPVAVFGWQRFVQIATGLGNHVCGVTTVANLYCWGLGTSGQLGFGIRIGGESVPIVVPAPHS